MSIDELMAAFYREISTMALTEQDKIECRDIAHRIIKEVVAEHVKTCPHGIAIKYSKKMIAAVILGACLGSGLAGGAGVAIAKYLLVGT